MYPWQHQRAIFEGWRASNASAQPMMLSRSAWAGSQRWGAAVWSGDTRSTWESLALQLPAGLNMVMSGIPWWTFDIGGFQGGNNHIEDAEYRELVIRWFQLGAFMPIMRMHGARSCQSTQGFNTCPNEPWSYGPEAYVVLADMIRCRERLRPYVDAAMAQASASGRPPVRPLFFDFPGDAEAWKEGTQESEYMFGDSLLVAPVTAYGVRSRRVYLPAGATWKSFWGSSQPIIPGGRWINANAPLESIPVFVRQSSSLPLSV